MATDTITVVYNWWAIVFVTYSM